MVNLSTFLKWHAARTPDKVALVFDPERITYSDFYDRTLRMAAFLRHKGIGEDNVVAVFMKNSAAFLEIAFATSHLGAVFLPINYRLARDEAEEPAVIITISHSDNAFVAAFFSESKSSEMIP